MDEKWQKILLLGGLALAFYIFYKQGTESENGEGKFDLTVKTEGAGGVQVEIDNVIKGTFEEKTYKDLPYGTSIVLKAKPDVDSIFENFDHVKDFTIKKDVTITAHFSRESETKNPFNLTDREFRTAEPEIRDFLDNPEQGFWNALSNEVVFWYPGWFAGGNRLIRDEKSGQEYAQEIANILKVGVPGNIAGVGDPETIWGFAADSLSYQELIEIAR